MSRNRVVKLPVRWRSLGHPRLTREQAREVELRALAVMESWDGTRWVDGQQRKGVGVDCRLYGQAVLDELFDFAEPTALPKLPQDVAIHRPDLARAFVRAALRAYGPCYRVIDGVVETGDVLVVGPPAGGPSHWIFFAEPGWIWQSAGGGVHKTGASLYGGYCKVFAIYRTTRKDEWLKGTEGAKGASDG